MIQTNLKENILDSYHNQNMSKADIAKEYDIPRSTIHGWLKRWEIEIPKKEPTSEELLQDKIKTLEMKLKFINKNNLSDHHIREKIIGLVSQDATPPAWLLKNDKYAESWGAVPTVFISDVHWGEVVAASQIGGVNTYDLDTAHQRLKNLVETTMSLLDMVNGQYPGIVVALGGDMLSGDIHDELTETNEMPMMPVFLDLYEKMIWAIKQFADRYDNVFIPCVTGNHSRTSMKPRAKSRNFTNFDWLLYTLLAKHFEDDKRVKFLIPDGPDALFKVYNTKYLLTHGDQFRGGDGMIGCLGPIIRGDHKKRSRNGQIEMDYDCMMCGHWHQLIQMQRLIVNGSMIGYNEYAYNNNFGFEPPRQALWLTHPDHGITLSMAVNVDRQVQSKPFDAAWVSWKS